MIEIIIEVEGGMVTGVYTDADPARDFNVAVLDHDYCDVDAEREAQRLTTLLDGPGWRGID